MKINQDYNSYLSISSNPNPENIPTDTESNNNFKGYINNNENKFKDFIYKINNESNEFTFKKRKKSGKKKKPIKTKEITFKKNEKVYKFKKYNDFDIGLTGEKMEEIIQEVESEIKLNKIADKEEDYSSDEEEIKNGEIKCANDLMEALDTLKEGKINNLFHINYNENLLKTDENIKKIKEQILNPPEIEYSSEEDEEDEED